MLALACLSAIASSQTAWQRQLADGDRRLARQELLPAEDCYRQALKEVKFVPHSGDDAVQCMESLAAVLQLENKTDKSVPVYKKARHIIEHTYGKETPKLLPILLALGAIAESEGYPQAAIRLYAQALAINENSFGPTSVAVAESLHSLGRANFNDGQRLEAENHYRSSLSILMQQPSLSSSVELESLLSDYIDLLKKLDIPTKILRSDFQSEMLKDQSASLHPTMAVAASSWQKEVSARLARQSENKPEQLPLRGFKKSVDQPADSIKRDNNTAFQTPHRDAGGKDFYERMIAIDIKALGPNHPAVADDLNALAGLYVSEHEYDKAKPLIMRALAIYESVYGADNLLVTKTRAVLAFVSKDGNETEGSIAGHVALSLVHIPLQSERLEIARRLNELAFLCYCQGKLQDALTVYRWALSSTEHATGERSVLSAACLTDYEKVRRVAAAR